MAEFSDKEVALPDCVRRAINPDVVVLDDDVRIGPQRARTRRESVRRYALDVPYVLLKQRRALARHAVRARFAYILGVSELRPDLRREPVVDSSQLGREEQSR